MWKLKLLKIAGPVITAVSLLAYFVTHNPFCWIGIVIGSVTNGTCSGLMQKMHNKP